MTRSLKDRFHDDMDALRKDLDRLKARRAERAASEADEDGGLLEDLEQAWDKLKAKVEQAFSSGDDVEEDERVRLESSWTSLRTRLSDAIGPSHPAGKGTL